ncbi:response regulator [Qipengyuania psychrotolerans]|uniref:Response regulator n=1 Tax=Qipengyuania psychrotolerans TaxID=2867238 RepID=A0ABX8ZH49_9SPHN|nr:response regulator [Qipengyuania psychrotolerans]QZD86598.1 response regulator [Qipengyuania psychrotolerans]
MSIPRYVLVVEDEAILGLQLEDALLDAGVEKVEICSTTEAALASLKRSQPDVIVLDVHLADRDDGWAIAELVRELGPDSPQIVFSTGQPEDIPQDIAELGYVLQKPYDPEVLVDLLSKPKKRGVISRIKGALRDA